MLRKQRKRYARWLVSGPRAEGEDFRKKAGNTEHLAAKFDTVYCDLCSIIMRFYGAVISQLSAVCLSRSLFSTYGCTVFTIFWFLMDCYKPFLLFYLFKLRFKYLLEGLCRPLNVQFCIDRCFLSS